jgi:hypothetical protein
MHIPTYLLVLLPILSIFLMVMLPVWLFLRMESMRGDITNAVHQVNLMAKDYNTMLAECSSLQIKIADVSGQLQGATIRAISTEETIRSLGNKINSRDRVEKRREAEEAKKGEENLDPNGWQQQALPLFDTQPVVPSPVQPKRKFGVNK